MGLNVQRRGFQKGGEKPSFVIAVAGNPNVGKSTLFNALTGMNQHTGNWPGKTVGSARGYCESRRYRYELVDTPGAYSLFAHSAEEEVTRDFLCFGQAAAVLVVCDATCLERNLNLVLQILELHDRVLVCVNLMDEARRRGIQLNLAKLEENLGVPVVGIVARKKKTVGAVLEKLDRLMEQSGNAPSAFPYPSPVNEALSKLEPLFIPWPRLCRQSRWMGLRALEDSTALTELLKEHTEDRPLSSPEAETTMAEARGILQRAGISGAALRDLTVRTLVLEGERIAQNCVICRKDKGYSERDRKLDRFLTGRRSAFPIMILLLLLLFWLTLTAANVPSVLLNRALSSVQDWLSHCFYAAGAPAWLHDALVLGAWRVLAWVVSVMLPTMAIFFPLFTILEDSGYLPRIAYNLDRPFQCCHACGKQALCICMGLGCNAAGVVGCRIIDSPRERLIAILTNCFTCNERCSFRHCFGFRVDLPAMCQSGRNVRHIPSAFRDVAERCPFVLHVGNATLSAAAAWQGFSAFPRRTNAGRAGQSSGSGSARRTAFMGIANASFTEWNLSADWVDPLFRRSGPSDGAGRHSADSLSIGLSCE